LVPVPLCTGTHFHAHRPSVDR